MKRKSRVIVAMSGGVDSSVAAALLKKQGYEVIGIFMKLWSEEASRTDLIRENICCSAEAAAAARGVANKLGIPFYVINLRKEFKETVVDDYIREYEAGRTPNPCVICNRDIKGEILIRRVLGLEGDFLATGHYARLKMGEIKNQKSNIKHKKYYLYQGKDLNKDQTYFLWTLTQEKLSKMLFPVGDLIKPQVRTIAKKLELPTAERKESQGNCFIPDRDVCGFLRRHAKKLTKPGPIYDTQGHKLGLHAGLINYTIGQKERLGLGGPRSYYVVKLDSRKNVLIVGDEDDLYRKKLIVTNLNWINSETSHQKFLSNIGGRIRYGHPIETCSVKILKNKAEVTFENSQRAITPGQSIVFYERLKVLGGGVIDKSLGD
jgi:tRNA-specific 2-thiouridylase